MTSPREALELWPLLTPDQQREAAERMRPGIVEMCVYDLGAADADEVRDALEMLVTACRAELDADTPSPLPRPLSRAERRARR